ncbi:MAG: hypothetical protein Q9171_005754 [Xanthocarpia ochracea]
MEADSAQPETGFGGHFSSYGGPQIMGNSFSTGGGPVYFDSSSDNRLPTSVCELPDFILSPHFTGRGDELQQIDRVFSASSGDLPGRCVIHGMPGVGKTQLALRYATLASETSEDIYTFWVSAGSVDKLARDFAKLVDLLHLPKWYTMDQATKVTTARAWLEDPTAKKKWLLVLDNVTQETIIMISKDILPRRNSGGRLLLTTRTAAIAESCTIPGKSLVIALQPPGTDDAVAMLAARSEMDSGTIERANNTDLERLVKAVGNLPLAIDQAASYLKGYEGSTKGLLDLYKSEEAMEFLSWENDLSRYEERSVVATFMPPLNRISQTAPDAVTLLRILCFCDPESIPISVLKQGCSVLSQEDWRDTPTGPAVNEIEAVVGLFRSSIRLSKAIQEIQRLSLAVYTTEGSERIVRIHDLVQLLLRSKLIAAVERDQWLEIVICVVCKAFEEIGDPESPQNWGQCGQFVSHIEFMGGFAAQYGLHNATLLDASTHAAMYLNACGLYQKAASMHRQTYERRKAAIGEEHPDTLTSMNNLASIYLNQGRWKDAQGLEEGVLETRKRVSGEEHLDTLISMNNLASTYWRQGRWKEAKGLQVGVLETRKRVLGEEHPDTLTSMNNLASTYWRQGRWKDAQGLEEGVLETSKRVLGEEHPDTLISMNNLASIYLNQGRWKDAQGLEEGVLETRKRVLGEEHPDTLISINNLALTYWYQGRWKEAEGLHVGVLETRKRVLGEEHPDTLNSMNNLAYTWKDQGQDAKAISLMGKFVYLKTRILGANHPDTLESSATFTEWQTQEPELDSSATNNMTTTEGEPSRLDKRSDRAIQLRPRKKGRQKFHS